MPGPVILPDPVRYAPPLGKKPPSTALKPGIPQAVLVTVIMKGSSALLLVALTVLCICGKSGPYF